MPKIEIEIQTDDKDHLKCNSNCNFLQLNYDGNCNDWCKLFETKLAGDWSRCKDCIDAEKNRKTGK